MNILIRLKNILIRKVKVFILNREARLMRALYNFLWANQSKFDLKWDGSGFLIHDGKSSIVIGIQSRIGFYGSGIQNRLRALYEDQYLLKGVKLGKEPVMIDVGANIGEFSMYFKSLYSESQVLALEPDKNIYEILLTNTKDKCTVLPYAAWFESGILSFYLQSDTADSSLIEPKGSQSSIDVEAWTIDDLVRQHVDAQKGIDLFKIEAEGAEPEVIRGSMEVLQKTKYVVVDVGPERGVSEDNTLVECVNLLHEVGFRLVRYGHSRHVVLFEKV